MKLSKKTTSAKATNDSAAASRPPKKQKSLTMEQLRQKAAALGIVQMEGLDKPELIHSIQIAEGYTPCFGTTKGQCPYTDCCFMADCIKYSSEMPD